MYRIRKNGSTSNIERCRLLQDGTGANPGYGKTGLTGSSSGLIISTIADNESAVTVYTQAATHIQTIATLGTYAAPSASQCRFGEIDSTNSPGDYELQFADARYAVSGAKSLRVTISGVTGMLPKTFVIQLSTVDVDDVNGALQGLKGTTNPTAGPLLTSGTGANQVQVNGTGKVSEVVLVDTLTTYTSNTPQSGDAYAIVNSGSFGNAKLTRATVPSTTLDTSSVAQTGDNYARLGAPAGASIAADIAEIEAETDTLLTGVNLNASQHVIVDSGTVTTVTNQLTAAQIATGVWQDATAGDFTTASSIGKSLYTSGNAPGAASGIAIVGSAMALTSGERTTLGGVVATSVWTDTTAVDFTTATSPGKIIFTQLGGAFTTTSSSVFSVAALANGPSGSGSSPAAIATAVWEDLLAGGDFGTAGSIGALLAAIGSPMQAGSSVTLSGDLTSTMKTSVENAVWNATESSHTTAGSMGAAMNAAGSAGDPWATTEPGAYASGTFGYLVSHNLDTNVSSRGIGTALTASQVENAVLDGLTANHSVAGSFGLLIATDLDATVSSRLAISGYTAPTNVFTITDQTHLTSIFNKLPTNNMADETLVIAATSSILSAVGTPMQVGNVTVGGYASGQDPWSIVKAAVPSNTPTLGQVEWLLRMLDADEFIDTTTTPWNHIWMVRNSGGLGVGTELMRKKLYDVGGANLVATTTVAGEVHQ